MVAGGGNARWGRGLWRVFPAFLLPLLGCYSFTGTNLPSYVHTIAVPNFENSTLEPGVDQQVTRGVTQHFIDDGRLKLASGSASDARVIGEIVGYDNKVNNYSADQNPIDYIVVLRCSVRLRDQVKNRDLWSDDALIATAVYQPGAATGAKSEEEARQAAIDKLATDIVTRTLEQW